MCGLEPDIIDLSPENYHTKDINGHLISFFPVNKYTLVHYHSSNSSPPLPSPLLKPWLLEYYRLKTSALRLFNGVGHFPLGCC